MRMNAITDKCSCFVVVVINNASPVCVVASHPHNIIPTDCLCLVKLSSMQPMKIYTHFNNNNNTYYTKVSINSNMVLTATVFRLFQSLETV